MLGFPIRTSPDQRLVGDSPRLNAASHVLHRLLMPRHPPCALKNLATKMLASTMQFTNNNQTPAHPTTRHPSPPPTATNDRKHQTRTGMTGDQPQEETQPPTHQPASERPVPSGPNSVPNQPQPPEPAFPLRVNHGGTDRPGNHDQLNNQCSTNEHATHRTRADERDTWTSPRPSHEASRVTAPAEPARRSLERR